MKEFDKKIVILGGGPAGIGAAWRLNELGYKKWELYEKTNFLGGLSTSFKDGKGFTWDIGGHIYFSKFDYFNEVYDRLIGKDSCKKERNQFIFIDGKYLPYPFQNNIRYLNQEKIFECVQGLIQAEKKSGIKPKNFYEFNLAAMGFGIAKHFMNPYNDKVWSWPAKEMSYSWIGNRVSVVNLEKVLENIILQKDDEKWGPNYYFKYPKNGSGSFWRKFENFLPSEKLNFCNEFKKVDVKNKKVYFNDGKSINYDFLISTLPLNFFVSKSNNDRSVKNAAKKLKSNSGYVIGVGIKGNLPKELKNKVALYFPEKKYLFHRMAIQNYFSEKLVPKGTFGLAFEISHSKNRKITQEEAIKNVFDFISDRKFIKNKNQFVDLFTISKNHFYPIPTLDRDKNLSNIQIELENSCIYSIGRFGAWRYESGNMDHSFMQGVEAVDSIYKNKK